MSSAAFQQGPEHAWSAPGSSATAQVLRGLLRRPTFVASAGIVIAWVIVAASWRLFDLDPFSTRGLPLEAPSAQYLLGTDLIGRDVFARVLAGAESALLTGTGGAFAAALLGSIVGIAAGYWRGTTDTLIMRFLDLFLALPTLILMIVLVGAFGVTDFAVMIIVGVLFMPATARIIRAAVLVEITRPYIIAARLQRESLIRLIGAELLPNILPTIIVQATLSLAGAIFMTASLSFLGLGATPPSPNWGLTISENRVVLQAAWWPTLAPALAIASVVVATFLIADNLKEVLER